MSESEILDTVLREMVAIGHGWRCDWSHFDGRELKGQLNQLAKWAETARDDSSITEYMEGTKFSEEQAR